MIRPRSGDFIYSQDEVSVIAGALDEAVCKRLLQAARPAPCTLHRAFDLAKDWRSALDQAITLGFKVVLTSGQAATAVAGRDKLKKMKKEAGDQIQIMAGSGVNSKTLPSLLSISFSPIKSLHPLSES
ncbi:CutC family protein [Cooperia oncophora]